MRIYWSLSAISLALVFSRPAMAQRALGFGASPTQITNQPIDTSNSAVPIASPQVFNRSFRLVDYFPKFSFSAKPTIGRSNFPTFGQLPGKDYLKAFGYNNFQPIK